MGRGGRDLGGHCVRRGASTDQVRTEKIQAVTAEVTSGLLYLYNCHKTLPTVTSPD